MVDLSEYKVIKKAVEEVQRLIIMGVIYVDVTTFCVHFLRLMNELMPFEYFQTG